MADRARLLLVGLLAACGAEEAKPPACAEYTCPVGTFPDEYRTLSSSSEQYVNVVEGECRYACVAAQTCPEGWWPLFTEECFSCATILPSGEEVGGDCDADNWVYWYDVSSGQTESGPPECDAGITARRSSVEPDDTREQATDLGRVSGGVAVNGYLSITTDTYFCGEGNTTGQYGEVDWFRFELEDCVDDARIELTGVNSWPSVFVYQDDELIVAPEYPGQSNFEVEVENLSGTVELGVACWDSAATDYTVEVSF